MSALRKNRQSEKEQQAPPSSELTETKSYTSQLEILNRVLTATRGPYEVPELLDLLVKEIVDAVEVRWGTIKLRGETGDTAETMIRQAGLEAGTVPRAIENTAFYLVMGTGDMLVVDDLTEDERFPASDDDSERARTLLAAPIQHKGELIGVLTLVDRLNSRPFGKSSKTLVSLLAGEAGGIIKNAWLMEEVVGQKAMEQERIMAETVWRRFLPEQLPDVVGFELAACCHPASSIGGDYYDAIPLSDGRTLLAIGDVSGSGMAAALLMSNLQASLRIGLRSHWELSGAVELINEHMCSTTDSDRYATLFLGALDPENHRMEYVNAGHTPPVVMHADGTYETLPATGIPVGFEPKTEFEAVIVTLSRGDRVIIYSDGITEAISDSGEMFEIERLAEVAITHEDSSAEAVMQEILTAVEQWSEDSASYQDDITLVIVMCCD
jgi:sulfur transfer complex TusBCD TusB component (DsrH family)